MHNIHGYFSSVCKNCSVRNSSRMLGCFPPSQQAGLWQVATLSFEHNFLWTSVITKPPAPNTRACESFLGRLVVTLCMMKMICSQFKPKFSIRFYRAVRSWKPQDTNLYIATEWIRISSIILGPVKKSWMNGYIPILTCCASSHFSLFSSSRRLLTIWKKFWKFKKTTHLYKFDVQHAT